MSEKARRRVNTLIADDEKLCRDILNLYLRGLGHRVYIAEDGHDALAAFKANADVIDLVILDVHMSGPGSIILFHCIREIAPAVPILFSSGVFEDGSEIRPIGAPRTAFLPKPFTRAELVEIITLLLEIPSGVKGAVISSEVEKG